MIKKIYTLEIGMSLFIICLVNACSLYSSQKFEETNISSSNKNRKDSCEIEDFSSISQYENEITANIPEFLTGYLDFGTYEPPVRIPNSTGSYNTLEISSDNKLEFPESIILAIIYDKSGTDSKLWTKNDSKIKEIIGLLQNIVVNRKADIRGISTDYEQDTEVSFVILKGNGKYALLTFRSFKDNYVEILIQQEDAASEDIYYTNSVEIHNMLREICKVETITKEVILNANNIEYFSENEIRVELSEEEIQEFKQLINRAKVIQNYSYACPFDLTVIIEADEKTYSLKVSTDSCGILVIGDTSYQLQKVDRLKLKDIFKQIEWNY